MFELIFTFVFEGIAWILMGIVSLIYDVIAALFNQKTPEIEDPAIARRIEHSSAGSNLRLITSIIAETQHRVRCARSTKKLILSYGPFRGTHALECTIILFPQNHPLPTFSILSDLGKESLITDKEAVQRLDFLPSKVVGHKLADDFKFFTTDNDALLNLLTPEVCIKLKQLKELFKNNTLLVLSEENKLTIAKRSSSRTNERHVSAFLSLARELTSALVDCNDFTAEDIPLSEDDMKLIESTSSSKEDICCQICGDLIGEEYVICTDCEVPHHKDCWEYNGRCSTFGCSAATFRPGGTLIQ